MEEEKLIPIKDFFSTLSDENKAIWFEQEINGHRFKNIDGVIHYHENGVNKKPITKKQQLLNQLQALQSDKDYERAGSIAQDLLLAYIGDKDITEAYNKINQY